MNAAAATGTPRKLAGYRNVSEGHHENQPRVIGSPFWGSSLPLRPHQPALTGFLATPAAAQQADLAAVDFRTALEPYGQWVAHQRWREVWVPNMPAGWQPYTTGKWVYTEEWGWYWVADEEWGWMPYHYGRWINDAELGWAWVPGREWGPAWVRWRQGTDAVGWAPLPPDEIAFDQKIEEDTNQWVFCPLHSLTAPRVAEVIIPRAEHPAYFRDTVLVNRSFLLRDAASASASIPAFRPTLLPRP